MKWKYIIVTEDGQFYGRDGLDQDLIDQWECGVITIIRTEDSTQYLGIGKDENDHLWGTLEQFPTESEFKDMQDEGHF